ncbi:hypothetical protein QR680_000063 [Steinernema hermaphroditum]|uniref:Uncharacterized protein n=1 Tax=Steinernema hermaphroditum TaxID=289476 RepID=A0AA39GVY9_9BILA|nr:hypothetical protein QR680_000063 [Steinernema hermaphroditum]
MCSTKTTRPTLCKPYDKRHSLLSRKKIVQRNRLVEQNGYINLRLTGTRKFEFGNYARDLYMTLLEVRWRYLVLVYFILLTSMWFAFALFYFTQAVQHGDLQGHADHEWTPCIHNAESFIDLLIFSFATQSTVGFGYRHLSAECPMVVTINMIQILIGTVTHGLLTGFIINKLARPTKRNATLKFSRNAVIAMRDGKLCLMIRIADMRKTCLAEAHVRMQMIRKTITCEGEMLPFHQSELNVGYNCGNDRLDVICPITVVHEINEHSPLYDFSKRVVESSGSITQARTSYVPSEILWGKKFDRLATYHRRDGTYLADLFKFNSVHDDPQTPDCSARELDEMISNGYYETFCDYDEESLMQQITIHDAKDFFCKNFSGKYHVNRTLTASTISDDIEVECIDELAQDVKPKIRKAPKSDRLRREFDIF